MQHYVRVCALAHKTIAAATIISVWYQFEIRQCWYSRKQVVTKNNRNKSRKTTTTLTYKHSNLLKTHTHTQKKVLGTAGQMTPSEFF